ncbi:hypothetical protein M2323_000604 [Rhodoblastus acidophilus]|nr:hypothetical protein [Rhodoblastus acidophilus]MCW2331700.1 hypothetical protein [Rhodoblastus acidophilus]
MKRRRGAQPTRVMPGLVPGIHAGPLLKMTRRIALRRRVDGRDKPGHDVSC